MSTVFILLIFPLYKKTILIHTHQFITKKPITQNQFQIALYCMASTQIMDDFRLNYEETKLCLGLPGGGDSAAKINNQGGKRGFSETVDLKLNLATCRDEQTVEKEEIVVSGGGSTDAVSKPPAKAQVVGWPPVRSFRKNILSVQKDSNAAIGGQNNSATFVKVSVDGAPYLRKVDLKIYKSYQQLSQALSKMFSSFTIGDCGSNGLKDFMNENKLIDLLNGSEYVPTYEDKDGDWMLVGDVPWEMFVNSCKRLRIMKGSEAIGLAPRAVEKCKNRS